MLVYSLGHVKRLLQGIGELTELMKNDLPFPSVNVPQPQFPDPPLVPTPPSITASPQHSAKEDTILPPPQNWTAIDNPGKVDFGRMKGLLEMKMGVNRTLEDNLEEREVGSTSPPSSPIPPPVPRRQGRLPGDPSQPPPQLPPKKNRKSPSHRALIHEAMESMLMFFVIDNSINALFISAKDELDGSQRTTFSVEDITAALGVSITKTTIFWCVQ